MYSSSSGQGPPQGELEHRQSYAESSSYNDIQGPQIINSLLTDTGVLNYQSGHELVPLDPAMPPAPRQFTSSEADTLVRELFMQDSVYREVAWLKEHASLPFQHSLIAREKFL